VVHDSFGRGRSFDRPSKIFSQYFKKAIFQSGTELFYWRNGNDEVDFVTVSTKILAGIPHLESRRLGKIFRKITLVIFFAIDCINSLALVETGNWITHPISFIAHAKFN